MFIDLFLHLLIDSFSVLHREWSRFVRAHRRPGKPEHFSRKYLWKGNVKTPIVPKHRCLQVLKLFLRRLFVFKIFATAAFAQFKAVVGGVCCHLFLTAFPEGIREK